MSPIQSRSRPLDRAVPGQCRVGSSAIVVVIAFMVTIVVVTVLLTMAAIVVPAVIALVFMVMLMGAVVLPRSLDLAGARLVLFATALEFRPPAVIGLIFPGTNEVHRSITGVVLLAVSAPIVRMFGW